MKNKKVLLAKRSGQISRWLMVALCAIVLFGATSSSHAASLKIYILSGQSNMEGHGYARYDNNPDGGWNDIGTLQYYLDDPSLRSEYAHLVDESDQYVSRPDVWVYFGDRNQEPAVISAELAVGQGGRNDLGDPDNPWVSIGPELGFGWVMGNQLEEQILLVKVCWGGKSLAGDFRPPSSGGTTGEFYNKLTDTLDAIVANPRDFYPAYDPNTDSYEIAGFGWHQGWNDYVDQARVDEYEFNMKNFIQDIRRHLGIPDLPFVIASSGMAAAGANPASDKAEQLLLAQQAPSLDPNWVGTVAYVETRDFWHDGAESPWPGFGYHWNGNFESYYKIGQAMGEAMFTLLDPNVVAGPDWISWVDAPTPITLTGSVDADAGFDSSVWTLTTDPGTSSPSPTLTQGGTPLAPTVTFTPDEAGDYVFKLTATNVGGAESSDSATVYVKEDACAAAVASGVTLHVLDTNEDCIVDVIDLAALADQWLEDIKMTTPVTN